MAYLGGGDTVNAETAFRSAISFGTRDASLSHNNIGVIHALNGEMAAAVKEFEMALDLSHGALVEARANINFCSPRTANRPALVAKLEYGRRATTVF